MRRFYLFLLFVSAYSTGHAQDTLRVMAYNVLYYGESPNCQGPSSTYHTYLRRIVGFAQPDVLALEKMGAIKLSVNATMGNAPYGFADSVVHYALNVNGDTSWAYCPLTNTAQADNMSVLFYNRVKLGYAGTIINYASVSDFNVYKLWYRDANLAQTHDTTWLYVLPNHTQSGNSATVRNAQISGYMQQLAAKFTRLPNFLSIGDFNVHNSSEAGYQTLVNPADTGFRCYDPPFAAGSLSYPADWDSHPEDFAPYLTTSTRESGSLPNSCGTSGGAKSWYDHLFLSSWLMHGTNYMQYLAGSYRTVGNDGQRLGISVNDAGTPNSAVPDSVAEALFQMSNKYPVTATLLVQPNTTGVSPADPDAAPAAVQHLLPNVNMRLATAMNGSATLYCTSAVAGKTAVVAVMGVDGQIMTKFSMMLTAGANLISLPEMPGGIYWLQVTVAGEAHCGGPVRL